MGRHHPVGVIHGRFQVLHLDHMKYLLEGKSRCEHLVVGIANPDPSLTRPDPADPHRSEPWANPLTYFERTWLIREALAEQGVSLQEFSLVPFPINVPELIRYYVPQDAVFFLTIYDSWGRKKLELMNSMGFRTELLWERTPQEKGITGEQVRTKMLLGEPWEHLVPPSTAALLKAWDLPGRLRSLCGDAMP